MRKQDLRKFDIHLTTSILSAFCIASLVFLMFWMFNFVTAKNLDIKFMLWLSYALFFLIALIVYLATKQPTIVWELPKAGQQQTSEMKYKLEKGQSYLVKEKKPILFREVFKEATEHGRRGMFITRSNPLLVKEKMKLTNAFLLWLTEVEAANAINPLEIEELSYAIKKYLKSAKDSVILLEGIEYLINILPFNTVLHFLQDLHDEIAVYGGNLLMSINPESLKLQQLKLIEKEFGELNHAGAGKDGI